MDYAWFCAELRSSTLPERESSSFFGDLVDLGNDVSAHLAAVGVPTVAVLPLVAHIRLADDEDQAEGREDGQEVHQQVVAAGGWNKEGKNRVENKLRRKVILWYLDHKTVAEKSLCCNLYLKILSIPSQKCFLVVELTKGTFV